MKRLSYILLITFLVVVGSGSMASAMVGIGVKAGLNFADLNDVESLDTIDKIENETKKGFVAGGHLAFPVSSLLKLQIEGLYSVKGSTGNAFDGVDVEKWENKLTYLEIPILLKAEFPTPMLKPFVYAGGSVSVLLKAEERIRADWFDIKDSLNSYDYGLVIGGGAELFGFTVEARYTKGLSDAVESPDPQSLVMQSRNQVYSVMVGLDLF